MKQQFRFLNIDSLQLDVYNSRLPKSKQGKDESVVIEYLLLEAATLELMESIGENDFFVGEMLLVIPNEKEEGKYIVIEGNRRLTAVMLLNNPELAKVKKTAIKELFDSVKFKPSTIPCLIFNNREEIQKYIGFVHITGKKSWRMLEKARYLYDLRHSEKFKELSFIDASERIAKIVGTPSSYVRKMLTSYQLYTIIEDEKFYQIDGLSDSTFFLNYFSDGLQKENIRKYINVDLDSEEPLKNLNKENLQELVSWWFKKNEGVSRVIGDSDGMKKLNEVLGNEVALEAFKKGVNIDIAYELTNDIDLQFERKVKESLQAIEQADGLSNKVKSFYINLYDDLKSLRQIAAKINDFRERREKDGDEF
ncbi:MAG: hypothetical protein IJ910_08210 [Bacteroidaceae bacterium]|nr:hypothetical protein [Bacteroidaceae bacterium]